jgi:hypothetical protein
VVVRARRELGKVRDGQHLMMRGDASHEGADLPRNCATDAGIDLVEHQGGYLLQPGQHGAQCQHHP